MRIKVFALAFMLCLVFVPTATARTLPQPVIHRAVPSTPALFIPCGFSVVPFSVYAMTITQTETLTLTFNATGDPTGLVTLGVNNGGPYRWARTNGDCGACTLTVASEPPGQYNSMQIMVTAAASACPPVSPSSGMTVSNFVLTVSPGNSTH